MRSSGDAKATMSSAPHPEREAVPSREQAGPSTLLVSQSEQSKKRKRAVRVACNACRQRRAACDAARPSCSSCAQRVIDCIYDTVDDNESRAVALRRENEALRANVALLQSTIQWLHGAPEPEALHSPYYQPIPSPNVDLSFHPMMRAASTPTESPLEYELMAQHPSAHPQILPFQAPDDVINSLLQIHNPLCPPSSSAKNFESDRDARPAPRPNPRNRYCDDRLHHLDIAFWTDVDVTNEYAASLISLYLETEHPCTGLFDADLFLTDLIGQTRRYCSSFLVNALLCYESYPYACFDLQAPSLAPLFFDEAKAAWRDSKDSASPLLVAALKVMILSCANNAFDGEAKVFTRLCRETSRRLALDSPPIPLPLQLVGKIDDEMRFRSHIAWGDFVSTTCIDLYYQNDSNAVAPSTPIPGSPGFALPAYMGSSFTAQCKLWLVCAEVVVLYSGKGHVVTRIAIAAMESKYQRLLDWADCLPAECVQSDQSPHHVATMHIWYHTAICFLMRPWMGKGLALRSFATGACGPDAVYRASLRQLKQLVLTYRLRYPQARYNVQWHPALIYVANAMLDNPSEPDWQFYFLACLHAYIDLSVGYGVAALCLKGLLTMAIKDRKFSTARARKLLDDMAAKEGHRAALANSNSDIRLDLSAEECGRPGKGANVDELAGKFEEIAMFEELVNVEEDGIGGG